MSRTSDGTRGAEEVASGSSAAQVGWSYAPPAIPPLSRVRVVDRFPWAGPSYSLLGRYAVVVGMEARIAPYADLKYGNDSWDYKLQIEDEGFPPVWLPSSCIRVC